MIRIISTIEWVLMQITVIIKTMMIMTLQVTNTITIIVKNSDIPISVMRIETF